MNPEEIEISVPWGVIAGKTWGASTNPIILLLHGLLDNAGSFDYLVPLLPYGYYYVSIDLPGHGKSSHISPNLTLQAMDYIFVVKLISDHFKRDKYVIIGHSFGAILGTQFSLIYPEKVDLLVVLDALWFELVNPNEFASWMRTKFDEFIKINSQIRRNSDVRVTYAQAIELVSTWRYPNCELTRRATEALLKRSIVECDDGKFKFTRDLRLRNYMGYPTDERYVAELLSSNNFGFKVVVILTKYNETRFNERFPFMADKFKKIGQWFVVEGNHHVHLNSPEIIAPFITTFLDDGSFPV